MKNFLWMTPFIRKTWLPVVVIAICICMAFLSLGRGGLFVGSSRAALPGENGKIAYNEPPGGNCSQIDQLKLINPDGSRKTELAVHGLEPRWSPDGTKVAYWRGSGYLYVANADGSNENSVAYFGATNNNIGGPKPAWSPDGKKIAFPRSVSGLYGMDLFVIDLESGIETRLTHDGVDSGNDIIFSTAPT